MLCYEEYITKHDIEEFKKIIIMLLDGNSLKLLGFHVVVKL